MQTNTFFRKWLWILISVILYAGCAPIHPSSVNTQITLAPLSITLQSASIPKTTSVPTFTTSPTLTSTITPTSRPTLTADEQKNYVTELVNTNTGCQLPCWWAIVPGKTTWKETESFMRYLGVSIGQRETESGVIWRPLFVKGLLREFDISFVASKEGVINTIFIAGNPGATQKQEDFESFWETYSPKEVIRIYGVPSRVLLSAPGQTGIGNTGNNGYILWIFYDHLGFMIRYDGAVADLPVYHFCPELKEGANNVISIDFTLQHPDHALPLELSDGILAHDLWRVKSIQDATGMSLEEFHQLFSQDEKPACFDTPHDIWPVVQP